MVGGRGKQVRIKGRILCQEICAQTDPSPRSIPSFLPLPSSVDTSPAQSLSSKSLWFLPTLRCYWLSPNPTTCCFLRTCCHPWTLSLSPAYNILSYHHQTSVTHLMDPASQDGMSLYPILFLEKVRRINVLLGWHTCPQEQPSDK